MKEQWRVLIQAALFVTTFVTTTVAGAEWTYAKSPLFSETYTWADFLSGLQFSVPFLLILTVHEFGHYFAAMYHRVRASLPWYIPVPPFVLSIGTLGAVIRIRSKVYSNIQHFDIGLAGPLAGFIVALGVLYYGFATLPPPEYIYTFHPEYEQYGANYADHVYTAAYLEEKKQVDLVFGNNLLFYFFETVVADPERVPNHHELMHYPILMAGFIALFFTSLNLLPIGQLDGGHVVYGLFGRKGHRMIASVFFILLLLYSGLGYVNIYNEQEKLTWIVPLGIIFYYICLQGLGLSSRDTFMYAVVMVAVLLLVAWVFPHLEGYSGWLFFGLLVGRLLGVHHPPSEIEQPLDATRQLLGWICLIIFIVCFSPAPLVLTEPGG